MNMAVLTFLIGMVLLLFGRKLFWLFVGAAGFLTGVEAAERFFPGADLTKLIIAVVIGVVGAFLAIFFYRAAAAIGGFLIGGYLAVQLMRYFAIPAPQSISWIPWLIGGILGAILILLLLDWALIVLSSFAGASMIVNSITLPLNMTIAFIVLVAIGIAVQAGILFYSRRGPEAV